MRIKKLYPAIKAMLVASACLFLSACAGTGPLDSVSDSHLNGAWKGRPVADAVGKWGKPLQAAPDGAGTTVYTWGWTKTFLYDQYTGSETHYTGESAQYHSDGHVTYSPEYQTTNQYQTKQGRRECLLRAHVDSSGTIMYLETQDVAGGCSDFYAGTNSSPPDAAAIARGNAFAEKNRTIKSIFDRYQAICANPEYAPLFEKSPCEFRFYQLAGARNASQVTPRQKELLAKWYVEMSGVVKDYLAFFYSTGEAADKSFADIVQASQARIATASPRNFLFAEGTTADSANQLTRLAKARYQSYFN